MVGSLFMIVPLSMNGTFGTSLRTSRHLTNGSNAVGLLRRNDRQRCTRRVSSSGLRSSAGTGPCRRAS